MPLDTKDGEELVIDTDCTETYSDKTRLTTTLYFLTVRDGEGNEFDYNELTSDITVSRYPSSTSAPA